MARSRDNAVLSAQIGQSYGEAYVQLPNDVPYTPNPYGEYTPQVAVAWQGLDGDLWKVDAPGHPLDYANKGTWAARAFAGIARVAQTALAQIAEKPGLETLPITSNAVTFDVAYPTSNFGPWLYAPMRSDLGG